MQHASNLCIHHATNTKQPKLVPNLDTKQQALIAPPVVHPFPPASQHGIYQPGNNLREMFLTQASQLHMKICAAEMLWPHQRCSKCQGRTPLSFQPGDLLEINLILKLKLCVLAVFMEGIHQRSKVVAGCHFDPHTLSSMRCSFLDGTQARTSLITSSIRKIGPKIHSWMLMSRQIELFNP